MYSQILYPSLRKGMLALMGIFTLLLLVGARTAFAAPVWFHLTGHVQAVNDPAYLFDEGIYPGALLEVYYSFDPSTPNSNNASVGDYMQTTTPYGITASVGDYIFQTDQSNVSSLVEVGYNAQGEDYYLVRSSNNKNIWGNWGVLTVGDIEWRLDDPTQTTLSSDALPVTALSISQWQGNSFTVQCSGPDYSGTPQSASFQASIDRMVLVTPAYTVTDLGSNITPSKINPSGQVTLSGNDGLIWTPTVPNGTTGSIVDIGILEGNYSEANDINSAGHVAGGSGSYPILWNQTLQSLGLLPGFQNSVAYGINDSDTVIGYGGDSAGYNSIPFIWSSGMGMQAAGYLQPSNADPGSVQGYAERINNNGLVAGGSGYRVAGNYQVRAYLWDSVGNTVQDLGTLPGGDTYSFALGINDFNQIIGNSKTGVIVPTPNNSNAPVPIHDAVLWQSNPDGSYSPLDLGNLGIDVTEVTEPHGINLNGQVVGYSWSYADTQHGSDYQEAFLWDSANGMRDLNDMIDPAGGLQLQDGVSINDAGQIVAIAMRNILAGGPNSGGDNWHALLLTPIPVENLSSVSVSPAQVQGGAQATGTLTLTLPAPSDGVPVSLSCDTPSAAQIVDANGNPVSSLTVPANQSSVTFTIQTSAIPADTTVTLFATYNGNSQAAFLTVKGASAGTLVIQPSAIIGGTQAQATLTLTAPAPAGGASVTLTSSSAAAQALDPVTNQPTSTITVPTGSNSAQFEIQTSPVAVDTPVQFTASFNDGTTNANLTVQAPTLTGLSLSASSVVGNSAAPITGTLTLSGPAPANFTASLKSSNKAVASVPSTLLIPAGSSTATFSVTTYPQLVDSAATLTATVNSSSQSATLMVTAPVITSVTLNPSDLYGGASSNGKVLLNGPAPIGYSVQITSNSAAATLSTTSLTFAKNATSAGFSVSTTPVYPTTTATITAKRTPSSGPSSSQQATLTINAAVLNGLLFQNPATGATTTKATGGSTVKLVGMFSSTVPAGATLKITSDHPTLIGSYSLSIPAGSKSVSASITTGKVTAGTTVKVSVTGSYYVNSSLVNSKVTTLSISN